jgi:Rrf2 family nitric oxide-sensitive transcriptional repressor
MYVAAAPEGRATIAQVAAAFGISESHLVKVAHLLGKEGLLINTRGRGGGLRLAHATGDITVARVVHATEGRDLAAECFDPEHNTCKLAGRCRLQRVLEEAVAGFYAVLEKYSLEDLRPAASNHEDQLADHAAFPEQLVRLPRLGKRKSARH